MDSTLAEYRADAHRLDSDFRQTVKTIGKDQRLTEDGKAEKIDDARAKYVAAVDALQADAVEYVELQAAQLGRQRQAETAKRFDSLLAMVGASVIADITRRRLAMLEPGEIVEAAEETPAEIETRLIVEYGLIELAGREPTYENNQAIAELASLSRGAPLAGIEAQLAELETFDVAQLNVQSYRSALVNAYGVDESAMAEVDITT